jgi:hypothetical protein
MTMFLAILIVLLVAAGGGIWAANTYLTDDDQKKTANIAGAVAVAVLALLIGFRNHLPFGINQPEPVVSEVTIQAK